MPRTKGPLPTDKHVGVRIRMRRLMLKMSQEKLGNALGVTFQQVQKYENGTSRVGASRLKQMSDILQVPVAFFFEGAFGPSDKVRDTSSLTYVSEFLATSEGLAVARSFVRIEKPAVRRLIAKLIGVLSDSPN
jgi:transcriptional regulator with XRE-family HTH domain